MNQLIDKFPTKIKVGNNILEINTNYKDCLNIITMLEDNTLTKYEKVELMLELLYKDTSKINQDNIEEAIRKAVLFLDAGDSKNNDNKEEEEYNIKTKRIYSFTQDAKYIYSAIKKSHGVDLENIEYLHWWKFVYYFLDLDEKSFFSQMIYLRNQKNKGKLTKDEKILYANLEDVLELENSEQYTDEEQEAINKFMSRLEGGKSERTCN